jgi:hypothetical protein
MHIPSHTPSHFVLRKREKTFDRDQGQQLRDRGNNYPRIIFANHDLLFAHLGQPGAHKQHNTPPRYDHLLIVSNGRIQVEFNFFVHPPNHALY